MIFKQKIYTYCLEKLDDKIASLNFALQELNEGAKNDTKSSAGDKHEIARAMMQLEQEKIMKQLYETLEQKAVIDKIDITLKSEKVIKGSLINTKTGYLFISIALGKIIIDKKEIIVLSPQSPLGIKLMGLKTNDTAEINGIKYFVEKID